MTLSIQHALKRLLAGPGSAPLSAAEMRDALLDITDARATHAQIAAFAVALRLRGETADQIAAAASLLRERALTLAVTAQPLVDTCGTGGDSASTFNISTTAAFIAAGAGVHVAKHGNRAVSSACGSAEVLHHLGLNLEAPPDAVRDAIQTLGIGFLFAPNYHAALRHAAPVRKELGVRTFFNLLGPLINPARAPFAVLGIYDPSLLTVVAEALLRLGARGALVVHSDDGLDEISLSAPTTIAVLENASVRLERFDPRSFGFTFCSRADLAGSSPAHNADILLDILRGTPSPRADIAILNAAAALRATGSFGSWPDCLAAARASIASGAALGRLEALLKRFPTPLSS